MQKGFTLVELLAVIVILAVIALIVTPTVLSIIEDSKDSATIKSAEFYISAIENAILRKNFSSLNVFMPKKCEIETDGNVTCDGTRLEIEANGKRPLSGTITFDGAVVSGVELMYDDETVIKTRANTYELLKNIVCKGDTNITTGFAPSDNLKPGEQYICEVKDGTTYRFFVLSTEGSKVNLIMESNLITGNDTDSRSIAFWGVEGIFSGGPTVAFDSLYQATKNWNKLSNIEMNYTDEGTWENSYGGVKTDNNKVEIFNKSGNVTASYKNLKARLPYKSEVMNAGCGTSTASCPLWLVNYTSLIWNYYYNSNYIEEDVNTGYWTMSTSKPTDTGPDRAYYVYGNGFVGATKGTASFPYEVGPGIRPVITVYKNQISK